MMRFPSGVTHAHQWVKNGDHPGDESEVVEVFDAEGRFAGTTLSEGAVVRFGPSSSPALHVACGSAMRDHGSLGGETVCPGNWITTTGDGYEVVPADPFADAMVISEDGDTLTIAPEGETIRVDFYADCRTHTMRRKFDNREERDTYAETHGVSEAHVVDVYEVVR